jgi:hypothetical protein
MYATSQFSSVGRDYALGRSRSRRWFGFAASAATIFALSLLPPLQRNTEIVVIVYGAVLVVVGLRHGGPGESARVAYHRVLPWVGCFFVLCPWEILNWFDKPYGGKGAQDRRRAAGQPGEHVVSPASC